MSWALCPVADYLRFHPFLKWFTDIRVQPDLQKSLKIRKREFAQSSTYKKHFETRNAESDLCSLLASLNVPPCFPSLEWLQPTSPLLRGGGRRVIPTDRWVEPTAVPKVHLPLGGGMASFMTHNLALSFQSSGGCQASRAARRPAPEPAINIFFLAANT